MAVYPVSNELVRRHLPPGSVKQHRGHFPYKKKKKVKRKPQEL
jgi:hypothetical protein